MRSVKSWAIDVRAIATLWVALSGVLAAADPADPDVTPPEMHIQDSPTQDPRIEDPRAMRSLLARQLQSESRDPPNVVGEPLPGSDGRPWDEQFLFDPCGEAAGDCCPGNTACPPDDGACRTCEDQAAAPPAKVPAWQFDSLDWWTRDLSVFAGVHGFKDPADQGRNANFGVQEGFNFGVPLGVFDWGLQVGACAAQSNFCGYEAFETQTADRNQYFVTGGLFHRQVDWGLQWGITYDWLHDDYYAQTDLKQIRSDSSLLLPGGWHEIGYFGAYGTGGTNFVLLDRQLKYFIVMEPTDIFAFYYRRYFHGGGEGRAWAGFSGRGDGIVGAELRVPMGLGWALENRINYLIPKQGDTATGLIQESWSVTIQLVWYPGQKAADVERHPFRPMLNVADNSLFMTDTFVPPGVN